jgi:hypothetical protein
MIIDYADHIITLRRFLRESERALLEKDWDAASSYVTDSVVELRLLKSQIELLKQNDGIPYQVELQQS